MPKYRFTASRTLELKTELPEEDQQALGEFMAKMVDELAVRTVVAQERTANALEKLADLVTKAASDPL